MISLVAILDGQLKAAGIPIVSVIQVGDTFTVQYDPSATAQQIADGEAIVAAFDPVAERAAIEAQKQAVATATGGAKAWYLDNPNATLLFELSIEDLETEVTNLVNALFPSATASNKNKMILLLMTLSVSVRVLAKREGFVD